MGGFGGLFRAFLRISTAPATVLAAAAEESPRKMQNSKVQGRTAAPSGSPGNSRLPTWSCPGGRESMHFRRVSRGFSISADPDIYIYIHSIHISGSAPSVTWSCVNIHMEICNFAMAKGLQCVLALFPRNNRFSESFLALFRAKWAVLRPFPGILRIPTAPPRFGSGR